jgi:hypothetical protein
MNIPHSIFNSETQQNNYNAAKKGSEKSAVTGKKKQYHGQKVSFRSQNKFSYHFIKNFII